MEPSEVSLGDKSSVIGCMGALQVAGANHLDSAYALIRVALSLVAQNLVAWCQEDQEALHQVACTGNFALASAYGEDLEVVLPSLLRKEVRDIVRHYKEGERQVLALALLAVARELRMVG